MYIILWILKEYFWYNCNFNNLCNIFLLFSDSYKCTFSYGLDNLQRNYYRFEGTSLPE